MACNTCTRTSKCMYGFTYGTGGSKHLKQEPVLLVIIIILFFIFVFFKIKKTTTSSTHMPCLSFIIDYVAVAVDQILETNRRGIHTESIHDIHITCKHECMYVCTYKQHHQNDTSSCFAAFRMARRAPIDMTPMACYAPHATAEPGNQFEEVSEKTESCTAAAAAGQAREQKHENTSTNKTHSTKRKCLPSTGSPSATGAAPSQFPPAQKRGSTFRLQCLVGTNCKTKTRSYRKMKPRTITTTSQKYDLNKWGELDVV